MAFFAKQEFGTTVQFRYIQYGPVTAFDGFGISVGIFRCCDTKRFQQNRYRFGGFIHNFGMLYDQRLQGPQVAKIYN